MAMLKKNKLVAVLGGLEDELTKINEPAKWQRVKAICDAIAWVLGKNKDLKIDPAK